MNTNKLSEVHTIVMTITLTTFSNYLLLSLLDIDALPLIFIGWCGLGVQAFIWSLIWNSKE